jgi:hypothetical protein
MSSSASRLHAALTDWSYDYAKDDAWLEQCSSRTREASIIELAEAVPGAGDLPPGTDFLYRGQGVSDEDMVRLLAGEEVEIAPSCRLFSSWSVDQSVADRFGYDAADACMMSAVVVRIPVERLKVICVVPEHLGHCEKEVLVHTEPLVLSPEDVVRAWLYDDDRELSREVESFHHRMGPSVQVGHRPSP